MCSDLPASMFRHWYENLAQHRKIDKEMIKTANIFEVILEHTHIMVVYLDPHFNFVWVNQAYAKTCRHEPSFFPGKNHFDLYPNNENEAIFRRVVETGQSFFITAKPFEFPDQPERGITYCDWSLSSVKDGDGNISGLAFILVDITDRVQAQEELTRIFNLSPDMICTAGNDGFFKRLNPSWEKTLGFTREELLAKPYHDFIHPDDVDATIAIHDKQIVANSITSFENRYRCKDGSYKLLQWRGTSAIQGFFYAIAIDITERKRNEQEIQALARFTSENPNPVLRVDTDGLVMYSNEAGLLLLTCWECRVGQCLPDEWKQYALKAYDSGLVISVELDCGGFIFEMRFSPVPDAGYVNMYGIDITEKKQAEEERLNYQNRLRTMSAKLSQVEERERHRIATYLHDQVGQSLAALRIKFGAYSEKSVATDTIEEYEEICKLLEQTIRDTRSLTSELSPHILYELGLQAALEWLVDRMIKEDDLEVEFESDSRPKPLSNDVQVLLFYSVRELLFNVLKHAQAHSVGVSVHADESQIYILVKDTGVGFDPVKVTSFSNMDFGFGLFNIRERIELIGGSLKIDSAPNHGTCITLTAPLKHNGLSQEESSL